MADLRKIISVLAMFALFVGLAGAQVGGTGQQQLTCTVGQGAVATVLRAEGFAEQTADITIACTGGIAPLNGTQIPQVNITIFYSALVTSRLMNATGNVSEALLLIDEPGSPLTGFGPGLPQTLCTTPLTGCAAFVGTPVNPATNVSSPFPGAVTAAGASTPAPNVYQGIVQGNSVSFIGVPVMPPTTTGARIFRITNVRLDATNKVSAASGNYVVNAAIAVNPPSALQISGTIPPVGVITTSLDQTVSPGAFSQCNAITASASSAPITLTFKELFASAFKTRVAATTTAGSGQGINTEQNVPGFPYNSESTFIFNTGTAAAPTYAGLAEFGTRLKAVFSNIPSGVTLYVSPNSLRAPNPGPGDGSSPGNTTPVTGTYMGYAQLVAVGGGDSEKVTFAALPGTSGLATVATPNGTGEAVWEVVNTDPYANETLEFGVYLSYPSGSPITGPSSTPTVTLSYAPSPDSGTAFATGSIPRFSTGALPPANIFSISGCPTQSQSISFGALPARTYGAGAFDLTATAGSGLPVTFASSTPSVCSVSGNTVAITGAGRCSIAASQAGDSVYLPAAPVTQEFAVDRANLTVTPDDKTITYGAAPVYTYSLAGLVNHDTSSVVSGPANIVSNATTTNGRPNAGTWTITQGAVSLSASNYRINWTTGTLTVHKAPLTVTANSVSKPYGAALPTLNATTTGFVNNDTSAVLSGVAGLTTTATASSASGSYPIVAGAGTLAAANYAFSLVNGALTVTKAGTAVALTTLSGRLVATVTVVAPGAGTPTGTVQFRNGSTILGTSGLEGSTASFPSSAGSFTAVYSGDGNFSGSTSNIVNIDAYVSSLSLSSSATPSTLGQAVTFTASVKTSGAPPNSPLPTGTVQFLDGTRVLGSAGVSRGQATYTTSTLTGGRHTIVAQYSGDATWPAASAATGQNVVAAVTMSVTAAPAVPVYGQTIVLTARVGAATIPAGFAPPTGLVTFSLNGEGLFSQPSTLGSAPLESGAATLTVKGLAAGTQSITAMYSGDATWSLLGTGIPVTVTPASTSTEVSSAVASGRMVLTGTVAAAAPAAGTPTGTVQFVDTANNMVVASAVLAGGRASATVAAAAASTVAGRPIAAKYAGDGNFNGSVSAPLPAIVNAAASFTVSLSCDEIASLFGISGLNGDQTATLPLSTTLGGVTVTVTDSAGTSRPALLYGVFASAGQINFVVPGGTAAGPAVVTIALPGGTITTVILIAGTAPGIFTANMTGQGPYAGQEIYVHPDGSQTVVNSAVLDPGANALVPNPIRLDASGDQVYLALYGTGIRHAGSLSATLNGVNLPVIYMGAQGGSEGLDQINLGPLPASLAGSGKVNLAIAADGQPANNVVLVIQ